MLIRIFRSSYVIKIFMFLIASLLLWLPAFLSPPPPIASGTFGIANDFLMDILKLSDTIMVLFAFAFLILQAIIFNAVLVENPLFSKSVFLPALIYVILMSHNPSYLTLHPALTANFFLILALKNLYNAYGKNDAFRESFNASFWVAVASLFYSPAIYMLLLVWSAFLIFRINSWREWVISLIGVSTPYLIVMLALYLLNGLDYLNNYYPDHLPWGHTHLTIHKSDYFFWPVFLILLLLAFYNFNLRRTYKTISMRKGFTVVNTFLIICAITVFFSGQHPHQHAYLMFPASAMIISYYFIESKKALLTESLFILLLISIIITKFI